MKKRAIRRKEVETNFQQLMESLELYFESCKECGGGTILYRVGGVQNKVKEAHKFFKQYS